MFLNDYVSLIQENFPYLFEEFGFHIAIKLEDRPGCFRVGLQSPACKIFFVREQGAGVMFFGPSSAIYDDDDQQWVTMTHLLAFFMRKEIDWSSLESMPYQDRMRASLNLMAKELKPYCSQLIEEFQSPEKVAQWKPILDQYFKDKVRR